MSNGWKLFWDQKTSTFLNKNKSDGAYTDEGRYVVWPVAVYVQSVIDGARIYPKEIGPLVGPAMAVFDHYYSPKFHAYCASYDFNGNEDIYFDDNAQVASCYLTAFEVTNDKHYLDKGIENVNFLMSGYDKNSGGVKWHMSKGAGASGISTAEVGVACARVGRITGDKKYIDFAAGCCDFTFGKLLTGDGLVADGLEGEELKMNETVWTYNQGVPLTLCSLLYFLTKDDKYKERAIKLATKVTDHNSPIFDRDTQNMDARYYRDYTYFYHLLAEGFADFLLYFYDCAPKELVQQIEHELTRTIVYIHAYLKDDKDGLYFQSLELFKIDEQRYEWFKKLTGENKSFSPNNCERAHIDGPTEKRPLVKCLIGCGGAARSFFQSARVAQKVEDDLPK